MSTNSFDQRKHRLGRGEFWAILAAISYSFYNVGVSWSLLGSNPLVGATLKIIPLIIISFFVLLLSNKLGKINPWSKDFLGYKTFSLLILLGFSYYIAGNLLLFASLKSGGVTLAAPILGTQVLWTAILGALILKERLNLMMVIGIFVSILGILLLSLSKSNGSTLIIKKYSLFYGLGAAIFYSFGNLLQRYLMNRKKVNYWIVIFMSLFTAELALNIIYYHKNHNIIFSNEPIIIIEKFLIAGIVGAAAIFCVTKAISLTNVANAVTINSSNIALSPILAFLILGENLNVTSLISIIIIFSGIILVQKTKPKIDIEETLK